MQPAYSIPPFTEDGLNKLVGIKAAWAIKAPRNPSRRSFWWGEITDVRFVNPHSAAVFIQPNTARAGHAKWHDLKHVRFHGHVDEPIKISIHRAQLEYKRLYETQIQSR